MVATSSGDSAGQCMSRVHMGNAICAGGCLGRGRLLRNNAVSFGVASHPGVRHKARRDSLPCSFSGSRGMGWGFRRTLLSCGRELRKSILF